MWEEVVGLKDGADRFAVGPQTYFISRQLSAVEGDAPCHGQIEPGQNSQQCRFSAAGGTDQNKGLNVACRQLELIEYDRPSAYGTFKPLSEIVHFKLHIEIVLPASATAPREVVSGSGNQMPTADSFPAWNR